MITFKELLGSHNVAEVPIAHQHNLEELLICVNKLRAAYGKPMIVTSPYRSMQEHLRIYATKGITDPAKIPMKSNHLSGNAVDFADPNQELQVWCKNNEPLIRSFGLWMEDFKYSPNWCHFQSKPYKSFKEGGSLWFQP